MKPYHSQIPCLSAGALTLSKSTLSRVLWSQLLVLWVMLSIICHLSDKTEDSLNNSLEIDNKTDSFACFAKVVMSKLIDFFF